MTPDPLTIDGPLFEDLPPGLEFDAPAITLTGAHAAFHQALTGDRLRLPLDHAAAARVTGVDAPLAHPLLAINVAIGQSTWASQRVKANLAYRSVRLRRPVLVGDTLQTTTRVVAARRNRDRPGRAPTGVVALEMRTRNQRGEDVLQAWRLPMIPCRDADGPAADDDLDAVGTQPTRAEILADLPAWRLAAFPRSRPAPQAIPAGTRVRVAARDVVTSAPEYVRLTTNMAAAHVDAASSPTGRRLVYGGHAIALAFAQVTRALPDLVMPLAWERCDHVAPVFEQDVLATEFEVLERAPIAAGTLLKLHVRTFATRAEGGDASHVLDWTFFAWDA
jgi:acyl dehydratase